MNSASEIVRIWKEINDDSIPLDLRNLNLQTHPTIPDNVRVLFLNGNELTGLFLPDSIEILDVSMNKIRFIHHLPKNLVEFYAENNYISEIVYFPNNLEHMRLCSNKLKRIPDLPNSLRSLYVSNNLLKQVPSFPKSLAILDISYNKIKDLPVFPPNLKYTYLTGNLLSYIPSDLPRSLRGGTFSYRNALPDFMCQDSNFPHIRGKEIELYRLKLKKAEMMRCKQKCDLIREEIMKITWDPETPRGKYNVLNLLDD